MIKHVALALALALPLAITNPAAATDYWDWSVGTGDPSSSRHRVQQRRRAAHRARKASATRVMAYEKRAEVADKGDHDVKCVEKVRGLGTQWIGTQGALDAAKKDWMERVRYDHGESYLDLTNARDFESRCGRTSIGEVAGQVTYRCEIVARPCKAPLKQTSANKE